MLTSNSFSNNNVKHKRQLFWQIPLLLFLIVGTIYIVRQQQSMPYHHKTGFIFGTTYSITYQCENDLSAEIEKAMKEVDDEFSMFNKQSTVSQINRGEKPVLSSKFKEVFKLAEKVHQNTEGAFDVTVAPLVNAWGFGFKNEQMPTPLQVDSLCSIIGMHRLTFDEEQSTITKSDPRVMLDFSAIAKGYGADCVARVLKKNGVSNFMVEIGGEVVTKGVSPSRLPWRIGVTKPVDDSLQVSQELQTVLNITDRAMATSGNYRNFYYKNGRKYAHTIDPHTGYPVQHSILSATVLAAECATADAYATSFMVMGLDSAKTLLDSHPELLAYIIYSNQEGALEVWYSPALAEKINE